MTDYEFNASLRDEQVLKSLQNIDKNISQLARNGEVAMNRISGATEKAGVKWDKLAKRFRDVDTGKFVAAGDAVKTVGNNSEFSATKMGILAGATTAVVTKLLEMGAAAARGFAEIIKGSVEAAKTLETATTSVTGILGGDSDAAVAALDRIRQESIRLGVDLTELAPAFLPKVEDLDQFAKVGELVASLANLDPAQGASGARLALNEALTGDLVSLQKRFEIDTSPIKEAQAEYGELEGLLIGLEEVLKARGQDFETLSTTAGATFNQTKQIAEDAKTTFGEPILAALKEDFQSLNQFLLENKDSIDLIASSLGDLIADVADLSGDQLVGFLEGLDLEQIQDFILEAQNVLDIIATIREVGSQSPLRELFLGMAENIPDLWDLETALTAVVQIMGILNATAAAGIAAVSGYFEIITGIASGEIAFDDLANQMDELNASIKSAAREAISEANDSIGAMNERLAENTQRLNDRTAAQNQSNDADLLAANNALANKQALEAEAAAAEEAATAQQEYNEAREDYEIDKERAAQDLALKQQRALLDAEIEFAQKREDIAIKNAAAIEDIYRKNKQSLADAAVDLRRDEEDIARNGARAQIEIEREAAQRRVEIETDFRRELQRIRERFDFDAQEAIRQNDAIAFLRIQRQKDFELNQAREQRDEEIQDAEASAIEQRQKLQEQLQAQIEDARIANQRKLEDLRVSLQRELQEQQIKYAREVQAAKLAEQRKREELARTFQRQNEDFQRFWDRKLQDLIRKYQQELQIIQQYEARKAQLMAQARTESRLRSQLTSRSTLSTRDSSQPRDRAEPITRTRDTSKEVSLGLQDPPTTTTGRRFGGYTPRGIDFLVGESGPEIVRFPRAGNVIPNHKLRFNPATSRVINNYHNTRQTNFNVDALSNMLSPQQIAIVQQLVNQLGMSIYS